VSAAPKATTADTKLDYRVSTGLWANAWKIAAAIGGIGILAALGLGLAGGAEASKRFAFSYLFAFIFFLSLGLGALFFVLIQHLTSANWSVTSRRTAEFFMAGLPVFALLFIPVVLGMGHLFPWLHAGHGGAEHTVAAHVEQAATHETAHLGVHGHADAPSVEHPQPHEQVRPTVGEPGAGHVMHGEGHEDPYEMAEHQAHAATLAQKLPYLNRTFFFVRAAIYFLVWIFLSMRLFGWSTRQDTTRDPKLTVAAQRFAPVATFLFALTLTFAGFDWLMSLDPMWYSTIFGVWIFAGCAVAIHALIILVTLSFRRQGLIGEAVNVEHYHDLGKLLFGFTVFWAYISFSQFFLTWYASIPEETTFYHHRWGDGPWKGVSLAILFIHFVLPFVLLLSRNTKRKLPVLATGAAILLVMHLVETYWIVLPNYQRDVLPADHPGVLSFHLLDVLCLLGVGGVYLAVVFWQMTRHALIPVGDPRLSRSLRFENF
jgi:hypothetical protein